MNELARCSATPCGSRAARVLGGYATLPVGYYNFLRVMQLGRQDSALRQPAF